ncbi:TPA: hypothetical protein HA251_06310 [Candidatus Woesearchaeota archaeon]|nr:hypothetical protein [Candidatus Woesearchaeota archaeon]
MTFGQYIKNIGTTMKYPLIYTAAFDTLTSSIIALQTGSIEEGAKAEVYGLPFFLAVNTGVAKGTEYMMRKFGKKGAYTFSLGISAAFYTYARIIGDHDPMYATLASTALGLSLTRVQASDLEKKLLNEKQESARS